MMSDLWRIWVSSNELGVHQRHHLSTGSLCLSTMISVTPKIHAEQRKTSSSKLMCSQAHSFSDDTVCLPLLRSLVTNVPPLDSKADVPRLQFMMVFGTCTFKPLSRVLRHQKSPELLCQLWQCQCTKFFDNLYLESDRICLLHQAMCWSVLLWGRTDLPSRVVAGFSFVFWGDIFSYFYFLTLVLKISPAEPTVLLACKCFSLQLL